MASILRQRRDTAANWTATDPVIPDGQLCFDTTNNIFKIGDGAAVYSALTIQYNNAVLVADTTTAGMAFVIDEDNMVSDLATQVPTQQSVKAYVDAEVAVNAAQIVLQGESHTAEASSAAAAQYDYAVAHSFITILTENITAITFPNPPASGNYGEIVIEFLQNATGSWTVAWPASVQWPGGIAPVITTTLTTGRDKITLSTRDGGVIWLGSFTQNYS